MRDMSDVRRLTELNPLLQQGMARPKAAEYLHLEEFEDGSEKGGGRFFSHITTTLGTGYMFFATGEMSALSACVFSHLETAQLQLVLPLPWLYRASGCRLATTAFPGE